MSSISKSSVKKSSKSSKSSKSVKSSSTPSKSVSSLSTTTEQVVTTPRKTLSPETIYSEFEDIVSLIETEVAKLRESSEKTKGVKFLRSLNKRLKKLHTRTSRVIKQKRKIKRASNGNSGFLKPVHISKDVAKFTGWNQSELKSRVDVTKYICQYIRDNDLQNPDDRRQILVDKKLSKLLGYNAKSDEPLTYYRIQTYMKKHFTNPSPKV